MIALKPGVKLKDLQPQTVLAIQIAEGFYEKYGTTLLTVTSGSDGAHKTGSLHYTGCAVDLRIHDVAKANRAKLVRDLSVALGENYDVIWEGRDTLNEHLHIEYDP